jgi:hypothetical protein
LVGPSVGVLVVALAGGSVAEMVALLAVYLAVLLVDGLVVELAGKRVAHLVAMLESKLVGLLES